MSAVAPKAGFSSRRLLLVLLTLFGAVAHFAAADARADFSDYGLESVSADLSTTQAGAHSDVSLDFTLKTDPASPSDTNGNHAPYARLKTLKSETPPGLVGDPSAVPACTLEQFASFPSGGAGCPQESQVGISRIRIYNMFKPLTEPVYNLQTSSEDHVAQLGFYAATIPYFINVGVRSGGDYGLTATIANPPTETIVRVTTELWGVPAAPSHDNLRLTSKEAYPEAKTESPLRPSNVEPHPFMTNPTTCGAPLRYAVETDSYQTAGVFSRMESSFPTITGCDRLQFEPSYAALPTSREAGGPTGLETRLALPPNEAPGGLAVSQLRRAKVVLPKGMTISPSAADGLDACTEAQVHYGQEVPAECPEAAKIGTAEFDVPVLSRPMRGAIYQRAPEPGQLFRFWLVSDDLGVNVKIPAEIHADEETGQLTTTFAETPQVPLRELVLRFKSGPRGVLRNPPSCGTYQTEFEFAPWSGNPAVRGSTPMTIDEGCGARKFAPGLEAGTVSPVAGSFSPFVFGLSTDAGAENLAAFDVTLPRGVLARLAGVPVCEGSAADRGDCGAASQVGTASVAVGAGSSPLWVPQPGKAATAVYLAGPYKGAPYSLVVKVPAQAGPFDLGTVVNRSGLYVDPTSTQVTVKTDPLPQILQGVPLAYRDIRVLIDRRQFTLNPTSCEQMAVQARVAGTAGSVAEPATRFQAADCDRLKFRPRVTLKLHGATRRGGYPALKAVLRARRGDANLGRVAVALPHAEFLAQNHIRTVCTRVQFAADKCPAGSVYGRASVVTPLLDKPLSGPVYLRSSSHPLPDLVLALRGQIDVDVVGRIDSVRGGIRTTFADLPDAPVSRFVLKMKGGKKGLLQNSRNLCAAAPRAEVKIDGQNGKLGDQGPRLRRSCGKRK